MRAYLSAYRQHGAALRSADGSAWGRDDATRLISACHAHWNPIRWSVADAQRITRSRPDRGVRWEPDEWQQPAGAVVGRTPIEVADEHAYEVDEDDLCLAAELVGQKWLAPVDTASPYMPGAVALALS